MSSYVAFMRGVNVGKRRVKMADLVAGAQEAGTKDPATYLASGNLVFEASGTEPQITARLNEALSRAAGFEIEVVLRSSDELCEALSSSPFGALNQDQVHVAFAVGEEALVTATTTASRSTDRELHFVSGRHAYLYLPDGMSRTQLPKKLGLLVPPTTIRTIATVAALAGLVRSR